MRFARRDRAKRNALGLESLGQSQYAGADSVERLRTARAAWANEELFRARRRLSYKPPDRASFRARWRRRFTYNEPF
ncbi:hypothetical protein, partial [Alicyclobacillus mali (ex Roth et al. 2021)]|uniref:hypothetical protein n=1 Tax=Alicyclobacillus mali (ex Roth et al. 2021) TaxID=1123961 RepID=UPI001E29778F